jgi:hypothetical protein
MDRVWLTTKITGELLKLKEVDSYFMQDSWIIFRNKDIFFSCRRYIDDKYPVEKLKEVISMHKADKMRGDVTEELATAVHDSLILAEEKEGRVFISLEFQKDGIQVSSDKNKGSFSQFVEMKIEDWEHLTIRVDGKRLLQALNDNVDCSFHIGYIQDKANAFILHKADWTEFFLIA